MHQPSVKCPPTAEEPADREKKSSRPLVRSLIVLSLYASLLCSTQIPTGALAGSANDVIHVKFRSGTNTDTPLKLFLPELRNSVGSITPLFTLPERELDRIGAGHLKLWFKITLKPETDAQQFMNDLKALDSVEIVERAPIPAPPPAALVQETIHVKFRPGTDTESPLIALPPELRNSVASIIALFTLPQQERDKNGTEQVKLWFKITLKPRAEVDPFIAVLKRWDSVEVVERGPLPAPPPQDD